MGFIWMFEPSAGWIGLGASHCTTVSPNTTGTFWLGKRRGACASALARACVRVRARVRVCQSVGQSVGRCLTVYNCVFRQNRAALARFLKQLIVCDL